MLAQKPNLQSRYPIFSVERTQSQQPPYLPPANAALVLASHMTYINLRNGSALRYLVYGQQDCSPMDETRLMYSVQGLANNGKDLVAGNFTVSTKKKLGTPPNPQPGGECQEFIKYNTDLAKKIEQLSDSDFVPNLSTLDQVFTSLSTVPLPTSYNFPQTGITVAGRFWDVWQGGRSFDDSLYINGLPLTTVRAEVSPTDGKSYQTQWFERARFEQHPENQPPFDVLLGLLGTSSVQNRLNEDPFKGVANPGNGLTWFPETRHTLGDPGVGGKAIAAAWNNLGGLAQFGYPLSQPFFETSKDDGKQYVVQYFQRQRFEYHPENKGTRFEVLLGRLGAEQMGGR